MKKVLQVLGIVLLLSNAAIADISQQIKFECMNMAEDGGSHDLFGQEDFILGAVYGQRTAAIIDAHKNIKKTNGEIAVLACQKTLNNIKSSKLSFKDELMVQIYKIVRFK